MVHTLASLSKVDLNFIQLIQRELQYYDEPKLWSFSARINGKQIKHDGGEFEAQASGFSFFSKQEAILKCLMESVERCCNFLFFKSSISCVDTTKHLHSKAINFYLYKKFGNNSDNNVKFRWTTCESLSDDSHLLVPCQSVWFSYPHISKESIVYPAISTGVAAGACLSAAILRGLLEVVERDAFVIYYLQKLPAPRIRLDLIKNIQVKQMVEMIKGYKMEIICFDISTDLEIPVMMSIVLDRTGVGKAVSVGLKSDLNPIKAIIGSMEESFHTRKWIRNEHEKRQTPITINDFSKNSDMVARGLLWYSVDSINRLDFWLNNKQTKIVKEESKPTSSGDQLQRVIQSLSKCGYTAYWKNLMVLQFKNLNIYVAKSIIPGLQPLYLNERYRLAVSDRMYIVPKKLGFHVRNESQLNTFPHPFL